MLIPPADDVFEALRSEYELRLGQGGSLVDLRRSGGEAVFIFRWDPLPDLFGVPVPLTETNRRLDWDQPAADLSEWLESLTLWLMEDVENGMLWHAARRRVHDYIELREPGWPIDHRFYVDVVAPGDRDAWLRTDFMARDGLNPGGAVARRDSGALLGWVTAYENNSTGSPYVAQATVVRDRPGLAHLDTLEAVPGAPPSLVLDVVRSATHYAAERAQRVVWTDLELEHLDLAGFRRDPADGRMLVDTAFLDEDPVAANELLLAELTRPSQWGQDRDRAGRYLPTTRLGALVHRLRYGSTGARRRTYLG